MLDLPGSSFLKAGHVPLDNWSFSLGPGERLAWHRAPTWPWVTRKGKKQPLVVMRHQVFGIVTAAKLGLSWIIPSFSITREMFSGVLSVGNGGWRREKKSPQLPPLSLGAFADMNLFYVSQEKEWLLRSRADGSMPFSYKEEEDFFFPLSQSD